MVVRRRRGLHSERPHRQPEGVGYAAGAAFVIAAAAIAARSGPAGVARKSTSGRFSRSSIRILLVYSSPVTSRHGNCRAVRSDRVGTFEVPSWLNLPRALCAAGGSGVGAALALFFGQHDLGPALMLAVVFLASPASPGAPSNGAAGVVLLAAGSISAMSLLLTRPIGPHVAGAVEQLARRRPNAQALWAIASGAQFGSGAGLGDTRYLPAGHTDLVLAALLEEFDSPARGGCALFAAFIAGRHHRTASVHRVRFLSRAHALPVHRRRCC